MKHHFAPAVFYVHARDPILCSCELDEQPDHEPSEADLDLARHLCPTLTKQDGTFTGDGFIYFPVLVWIEKTRTLRDTTPHRKAMMWARSTIISSGGGYWDPPEYDEVIVDDNNAVYPTLSAAIKQSMLDHRANELDAIDNRCFTCHGMAREEQIDGIWTCKACDGKGWNPISKPAAA